MKGMLIVIAVLVILLICVVPIATFSANYAFTHADRPWAPGVAATSGRAMVLATSYTSAREVLFRTAQTFPQYPRQDRLLFLIGFCYEKENNDPLAKQCYRQFLVAYPNHPWTGNVAKRLSELEAVTQ